MSYEFLSCLSLFDKDVSIDCFERDPQWPIAKATRENLKKTAETLDWCQKNSVGILHPAHGSYPGRFRRLEKPPLYLNYQGHTVWKNSDCLAVVGSRDPLKRSLQWMEVQLPLFQSQTSSVIVSGGARGVDQKAHALSIRASRPTLAFLPSGFGVFFPPELADWKSEIIESGGAVLSQFHPEQSVRRSHFEARNRLIVSMSRVVLVVEARRRSGSAMTARLANELSREVVVLPSFPGEAPAAGTLDLLIDGGAKAVRDSQDLEAIWNLTARPDEG